MKMAWVTDPHLNFLPFSERKTFYKKIKELDVNCVLISGDIAESKDICELLDEFSSNINQPIYFVLGNHDYYFSSVTEVRKKIQKLCCANKNLVWIGSSPAIHLDSNTILVGHDGWADARYGNFEKSNIRLNDSRLIEELYQASFSSKLALKKEMQKLADSDAKALHKSLSACTHKGCKNILIVTHIPPFPDCCWHQNKKADDNWLPYLSSKATGDVLKAVAEKYEHNNFLVFCGHTHSESKIQISKNLVVKTGRAEYYKPMVQELITLT